VLPTGQSRSLVVVQLGRDEPYLPNRPGWEVSKGALSVLVPSKQRRPPWGAAQRVGSRGPGSRTLVRGPSQSREGPYPVGALVAYAVRPSERISKRSHVTPFDAAHVPMAMPGLAVQGARFARDLRGGWSRG